MTAGKINIVGTGPGNAGFLTADARAALEECDLVIGYRLYLEQVGNLVRDKECIASAMGKEVERCKLAVDEARKGKNVALVSGGDPGIYGMAGLLIQVALKQDNPPQVNVIPGVTAASAAAAVLGAPLMHDFAVISLSDLLTPWELIEKRLKAAAVADLVIVLYNPRSRGRHNQLEKARRVILMHRESKTPVGIVHSAGRENQEHCITSLDEMPAFTGQVSMTSLVIIGNSCTYRQNGIMITPRGYPL